VNNQRNRSYIEFGNLPIEESLYVVNENVFAQDQIEKGMNLYTSWKSIENISFVSKSALEELDLTEVFSQTQPGDCSGGNYKVLPNVTAQETASGFAIEGSSKLPCLYTQVRLDKRFKYAAQISLNWESNTENMIGYCLYSPSVKGCLNKEKFLYTNLGFGNTTITFPSLLDGGEELSLSLYALNPKGEKASLLIRGVKILYSSEFVPLNQVGEYIDNKEKILEIENGQKIVIEIPIMNNGNSYVYSGSEKKDILWQPSVAQDAFLKYEVSVDNGLKQILQKQYSNQYQELFITNPLKRYLWYWSGENLRNIPSTVCLTYVGDDKCFLDSTFYDDALSSETRIFSSSVKENTRLDTSFNSISFNNETENVLRDFVVMEIPDQWLNYKFQSIFPREYTEYEALIAGKSSSSTFYSIKKDDISSRDTIISISQARADGWVAVGFTDLFFRILPNSSRVYLDGWKQGWDISEFNNLNSVFIFYWPNLLSYLGYSFLLILFVYPVYYFIKRKKIWKKIIH